MSLKNTVRSDREIEYRKCPKCGRIVYRRERRKIYIPGTIGNTQMNTHRMLVCKCGHEFHRYLLCNSCF